MFDVPINMDIRRRAEESAVENGNILEHKNEDFAERDKNTKLRHSDSFGAADVSVCLFSACHTARDSRDSFAHITSHFGVTGQRDTKASIDFPSLFLF